MKKITKLGTLLVLPLLLSNIAEAVENTNNYTLEQVVVFSRHGLRAPLSTPSSALGKVTPNQWPQWDTPASYLTTRGGVLETYFGHYFNTWLVDHKLLKENTCPTEKEVYIYANSLQRTIATAEYFTVGAFPGCNTPIVHKEKLGKMDDTFFPVVRNDTEEFKRMAIDSINKTAGDGGVIGLNQRLKPTYQYMEKIIDYKKSPDCLTEKKCNLLQEDTNLIIEKGKEPGVNGPLRTGTVIADALILQYYEGSLLKNVGWGKIKNDKQFQDLVAVKEYYNTILFGSPFVAKEVSRNLVKYIESTFVNKNQRAAKFTLLVGHDSNVASLFSALDIKPYHLPKQFETTPIGGKVVFEKWKDNITGKQLMKIEYIYQSTDQIRKLEQLNRANPPQSVTLEMNDCPIDKNGYCSFDTFQRVMENIIKK